MIISKNYGRLRREYLREEVPNKVFDGRTREDRLHDYLLDLALGPALPDDLPIRCPD